MFSSVQSLSQVRLFVTPMDCSMPGFPAHQQLLEPTQTHVHHISDAIQPSYPLSSPSPPTFNFPSISIFSNELVAKVLEFVCIYVCLYVCMEYVCYIPYKISEEVKFLCRKAETKILLRALS